MVNYNKLKGKIAEKYSSLSAFGEVLGMTPQQISKLVSGTRKKDSLGNDFIDHADILLSTVDKMATALNLTNDEIREIFFAI